MPDKTWEVLPPEPAGPEETHRSAPNDRTRLAAAFAVAVASDALSVWLEFLPPLQWGIDIATALALYAILGRQWLLLPALINEAIPGLAVLPAWVLVVASIAMWGAVNPMGGSHADRRT